MARPILREVKLRQHAASESLVRGHPWVWSNAIDDLSLADAAPGDEVQILSPDGVAVGRGLADPASPIVVRMWTHGRDAIDPPLWRSRAERACSLRAALFEGRGTSAYRLLHGEGDRMPGFVVDRYADVAVARTDGVAASAKLADLTGALWPLLKACGVRTLVHRVGARGETPRLDLVCGVAPPDTIQVEEHGVPFVVDLARGQKTGAFLDQRENRRRVGELARGRRVLNLFSYAGGFSLHAAIGGASHVTSVDIAAAAHATAQASLRAAGVDTRAHSFVAADVRAFLDGAKQRGDTWDLIVSDPPSFASSERALPKALSAYKGLHRACVDVLAPDGIFCAASCSSHVDTAAFLGTLDDAAIGGRPLRILELRGAGADHPTLAAFPEGRYLKFAVLG